MEKIKVNKQKLLEVLEENKKKHLEDYDKALEGYKISAQKELAKKMKELKNLIDNEKIKRFNLSFSVNKPESHEEDFDLVIEMLKESIDDEVYVTPSEFRQYYKNEWSWKDFWYTSNYANIGMAVSSPDSKYYVDSSMQTK